MTRSVTWNDYKHEIVFPSHFSVSLLHFRTKVQKCFWGICGVFPSFQVFATVFRFIFLHLVITITIIFFIISIISPLFSCWSNAVHCRVAMETPVLLHIWWFIWCLSFSCPGPRHTPTHTHLWRRVFFFQGHDGVMCDDLLTESCVCLSARGGFN